MYQNRKAVTFGSLVSFKYRCRAVMKYLLLFVVMWPSVAFSDALFYFRVGSSWTYQVEGGQPSQVTNKVSEVKEVQGRNWYKLVEYGEAFWVSNTHEGQVEAINFFDRTPSYNDSADMVLIYKFPANVGDTWNSNGSLVSYLGKERLSVPAGEFECHMYNINMGGGSYSKSCIAENVGVVYNEAKFENQPKEISRLIDFGYDF